MSEHDALPHLDPKQLELLRGLRQGTLLPQLLRTYREQAQRQIVDICAAAVCNDPAALAAAAHSLRSASFSVGASRIGHLCAELEADARLAPPLVRGERCAALEAEFAALLPELERRLA